MKCILTGMVLLLAPYSLRCQPVLPSWLVAYPGAVVSKTNLGGMTAVSYATEAAPDAVADHYRSLFENQSLSFSPTSNSFGTTVRAALECGDFVLTIRPKGTGSSVRASCTVKVTPRVARSTGNYDQDVATAIELHRQAVEEMGLNRARPAAPAPPLQWPEWLVAMKDAELSIDRGKNPAGNSMLKARFVTGVPMSKLFEFYKSLLSTNGYKVYRGTVQTGQTATGIKQNALGGVEGSQYPDGFPGPRTEIRIRFDRMYLNDPITVDIRFTTFAYKGSPGRER